MSDLEQALLNAALSDNALLWFATIVAGGCLVGLASLILALIFRTKRPQAFARGFSGGALIMIGINLGVSIGAAICS